MNSKKEIKKTSAAIFITLVIVITSLIFMIILFLEQPAELNGEKLSIKERFTSIFKQSSSVFSEEEETNITNVMNIIKNTCDVAGSADLDTLVFLTSNIVTELTKSSEGPRQLLRDIPAITVL